MSVTGTTLCRLHMMDPACLQSPTDETCMGAGHVDDGEKEEGEEGAEKALRALTASSTYDRLQEGWQDDPRWKVRHHLWCPQIVLRRTLVQHVGCTTAP